MTGQARGTVLITGDDIRAAGSVFAAVSETIEDYGVGVRIRLAPTGWDRVADTRDTRYSFMYDDLNGATTIAPGQSLSEWRRLDNAARKAAKR